MKLYNVIRNDISGWLDKRSWWFFIGLKLLIIWFVLSISIVSMLSIVGMSNASNMMEEKYNNQTITEQEYNTWNNLVIPIYMFAIHTLEVICLLFIACYIYLILIKFKVL